MLTFRTCAVILIYAFVPMGLLGLNLDDDRAAFGSCAITLLFVVGCIVGTPLVNCRNCRPLMIPSFLRPGLVLLLLGFSRMARRCLFSSCSLSMTCSPAACR